jgi:hypothetical protein
MRPKLLQPTRTRPHERRELRRRRVGMQPPRVAQVTAAAAIPAPAATPIQCDPAVARVREAGGPVDHASYSCECGYFFSAAVSTTVSCPHCGTGQAW